MLMVLLMIMTLLNEVIAQVAVFPIDLVVGLHGDAAFVCLSSTESFAWFINDTSLSELQLSGAVVSGDRVAVTFINVTEEYNNTRIECRGGTFSGFATLLVQDPPLDNMIFINWTAPFTLDITLVDTDITYCVDVVSSTSSATLHSECGINVTEFTYPLPPRSGCDNYDCFVTPVNIVGEGAIKRGHYSQDPNGPRIMESNTLNVLPFTQFSFSMSAPVCQAELMLQNIFDTAYESLIVLRESELTIEGAIISFNPHLLTFNLMYRTTIAASNVFVRATSNVLISTFDITDCSAHRFDENIVILVNFVQHTEATGALLSFIYINEDGTVDFSMSFSRAIEKDEDLLSENLLLNMSYPGDYVVYAYDIEHDKQIASGFNYQASACNFSVSDRQEEIISLPPQNGSCIVNSSNQVIYVECQSLSRFQVAAQINDSSKVNILHVNSSSQSIASVEVWEIGEYLLIVLPIQDGKGILSSMAFSYIHSVTEEIVTTENIATVQSLGPSSSRGPKVVINSECTTQSSILLLILLDFVIFICAHETLPRF